MKPLFIALAALLATLTMPAPGHAQILETYSLGYPIQIRVVSIADGEEVKFRTDYTLTSAPGGAFGDTVLSLVQVGSAGFPGGAFLAGADSWDCAGLPMTFEPSCFEYTNTSGSPQVAFLIARAWRSFTPALTRLYRNDTALVDPFDSTDPVFVGGGWSPATFYTWYRNHVTTAFMPGNAASHILIAGSSDIYGSAEVVYGVSRYSHVVEGLAEIDQFGISGLSNNIGVAYGGYNGTNEGPLRLLKNDWFWSGRDFDGDGLGHALEIDLGTCDRPTDTMPNGELCSTLEFCDLPSSDVCLARLRDTDHDGLRDDVEVYGYDHLQAQLPRWGADPVHRDVFVEMNTEDRDPTTITTCDGFQIDGSPNLSATDPRLMGGEVMSAPVFGLPAPSDLDFFDRAQRIYAQAPDWMNPDGTPGINLHFDVGIENPDPVTATLWGDWGGGGDCFDPITDKPQENYGALCANDIEPARSWLFHCAIDTASGAGQANGTSWYGNSTAHHVHELGHILGLGHGGGNGSSANTENAANRRPLYFSRINYRYQDTGADGRSASVWDAISFNFSPPEGTPMTTSRSRGTLETTPMPGRDLSPLLTGSPSANAVLNGSEWDVDWNLDGVQTSDLRVWERYRDQENGRNARGYKAGGAHEGLKYGDYGVHMDATVLDDMLIFAFSEGGQIYLMVDSDGGCDTFPSPELTGPQETRETYGDCMKLGTRISTGLTGDAVSIAPTLVPISGTTIDGLVVVYSDSGEVEWAIVVPTSNSAASEASIVVASQGYLGSVDHPVTLVEVPASAYDPHAGVMAFWSPAGGGALQQMHLPAGSLTWSARQNVVYGTVEVGPVTGSVGAVAPHLPQPSQHNGRVYTATRTVGSSDVFIYELPAGADENTSWGIPTSLPFPPSFSSTTATDVEIAFTPPPTNELVDEVFVAFNVPSDGVEVVRQRRSRGFAGLALAGEQDMGLTSREYAFAGAAMVYDARPLVQGLEGLRAFRSTHRGCGAAGAQGWACKSSTYNPGTQPGELVCESELCLPVPACAGAAGSEGCACTTTGTCGASLACTFVDGADEPESGMLCVDLSRTTNPPLSYVQYLPFAEGHNPTEFCDYDDWRQIAFHMCQSLEDVSAPTVAWDSSVAPYQLTPHHDDVGNVRCGNRTIYREPNGTGQCVQSYTTTHDDRWLFPLQY